MLETLVSSRIRRTLFEHILSHPDERFYLRGLAKALDLSISPLRRELKRLERSGMLKATQEGNMLFYTANPASPAFLQLMQAGQSLDPAPKGRSWASLGISPTVQPATQQADAPSEAPSPVHQSRDATPVGTVPASRRVSWWRSPLSSPALIGAACVGIALILFVAGLLRLSVTQERLASQGSRALATRRAEVTVVVPETPASSGVMRGARWQIVPGGFGGFSSGVTDDSY